jgi:hypothetical protein
VRAPSSGPVASSRPRADRHKSGKDNTTLELQGTNAAWNSIRFQKVADLRTRIPKAASTTVTSNQY